jgi:PAS domain S-box-containing protein
MAREIKSVWLRYALSILLFGVTIGLSILLSYLPFKINLTIPVVLALVAAAWYGGRGPGLLIAVLFQATTIIFTTIPPGSSVAAAWFGYFSVFLLYIFLVLVISGLKKIQDRLSQQRELLQVTLSSIGDAVIATDINGNINFLNPTAEHLTGWTLGDACKHPLHEVFKIINEDTRESVESPFDTIRREGQTVGLANHTILTSKDGRETPIDDSGAPIRNTNGEVVGAIIVFHDVSERRRIEQEREGLLEREQAARRSAESSDRLKDEFLATVSHELRTPLNSILGWAATLSIKKDLDEKSIRGAMAIIERNARAQSALINDILDVSRIITGKLQIKSKPTKPGPVVRAAIEILRPAIDAKGIELKGPGDVGVGPITGDPDRLQQIVWNLISNAVKFTPAGGAVEVAVKEAGPNVEIVVKDSGAGIREQFLPYVFERFRQSDSSTVRSDSGLGLGLSIVRHLTELHGGTVRAESEGEGRGAAFTVSIPLAAEAANGGSIEDAQAAPRRPDSFTAHAADVSELRGIRVLVVDDDPDTLEILCIMLTQFHVEVAAAASSEEALKLFEKWRPDVLISDLAMPVEDGFTLIRKIRAMTAEEGGNTPAAALTAYAREEDSNAALAAGFHSHVAKPIDPKMLAAAVSDLVRRSK